VRFGAGCAFHDGSHAAEGEPHRFDPVLLESYREGRADRGDVGVETLADLVDAQVPRLGCAFLPKPGPERHKQALQELSRLQPIAHVPQIELGERHPPKGAAPAQFQFGVQRHQYRRRVADGRTVGDVAAHRAGVADGR
jgi:hypothetical protein